MAARRKAEEGPPTEADALEGVPLPRERTRLVEHGEALDAVLGALASGRVHHAWLVTGPPGIGKATFAFTVARRLLAEGEGGDERIDRLVAGGVHPALLHLHRPWDDKAKRFRAHLTVDEVRRLVPFLGETAAGGGRRVVVVDTADDMNPAAANAILKQLEEPPRRTVFLVLAHAPGRLLPTIRSRCRTLALRPLTEAGVRSVLEETPATADLEPAALADAARLSGGSPRRAMLMLVTSAVEAAREVDRLFSGPALFDRAAHHALADRIAGGRGGEETFALALDVISDKVRALVHAGAAAGAPVAALAALSGTWASFEERRRSLEVLNLDRRQYVLDLLAAVAADPVAKEAALAAAKRPA